MSPMINDDHHDTRTCEGIADSRCLVETRLGEGVQSTQPHDQTSSSATGDVHSGVLGGSGEDCESTKDIKIVNIPCDAPELIVVPVLDDRVDESTPASTLAATSEDVVLTADDFSGVESTAPVIASASDVCSTATPSASCDLTSSLANLSELDGPILIGSPSEDTGNLEEEFSGTTEDEANSIQEIQQIPHASPVSPSNVDCDDFKHASADKHLVFTSDLMSKIEEMEKRFWAEKEDWLVRKRILDGDVSVIDTHPDEDAPKSRYSSKAEKSYPVVREPHISDTSRTIGGVDLEQNNTETDAEDSREVPDDWVQRIIQKAEERKARLKHARQSPPGAPVSNCATRSSFGAKIKDTEGGSKLGNTTMDDTFGIKTIGSSLRGDSTPTLSADRNSGKPLSRKPVPLPTRGLRIAGRAGVSDPHTSENRQAQTVTEGRALVVSDKNVLASSSSTLSTSLTDWLEDIDSGNAALVRASAYSSFVGVVEDRVESSSDSSSAEWSLPTTLASESFLLPDITQVEENPEEKPTIDALRELAKNLFRSRRSAQEAAERESRLAARQSLFPPTRPGRLPPSHSAGRAERRKTVVPSNSSVAGAPANQATARLRPVVVSPPKRSPRVNSAPHSSPKKVLVDTSDCSDLAASEEEPTSSDEVLSGPTLPTFAFIACEMRMSRAVNQLLGEKTKQKTSTARNFHIRPLKLAKRPLADNSGYRDVRSDLSCSSPDLSVDGTESRSTVSSPESSPPSTPACGLFRFPVLGPKSAVLRPLKLRGSSYRGSNL